MRLMVARVARMLKHAQNADLLLPLVTEDVSLLRSLLCALDLFKTANNALKMATLAQNVSLLSSLIREDVSTPLFLQYSARVH